LGEAVQVNRPAARGHDVAAAWKMSITTLASARPPIPVATDPMAASHSAERCTSKRSRDIRPLIMEYALFSKAAARRCRAALSPGVKTAVKRKNG
jgi:hypothetical protein